MYPLNPGTQQLHLVMLQMVETGTHNDMYMRPYQTEWNDANSGRLIAATNHGSNISVNSLASAAGMFMRPQSEAGARIQIPNGWGTSRYRFVMQLEYPAMGGGRVIQFVTGYTNKADASHMGTLDPNMMLYFNNTLLLQEITEMTPNGPVKRMRRMSSDQILSAEAFGSMPHQSGAASGLRTMRPEDVFSVIGTDQYRGGGGAEDLRPVFMPSEPYKLSSRENNSLTSYLARSLHRANTAASQADYDVSRSELANATSSMLAENTYHNDNFLAWVNSRQLMTSGGAVPWGELIAAAPGADHVAKVVAGNGPMMISVPGAGSTEYWTSTTMETIMATILGQTIPSFMLDNLIGTLQMRCTNRHPELFGMNGEGPGVKHSVGVLQSRLLGGVELSYDILNNLIQHMVHLVLPELSMSGMIDYEFRANLDLLGTSFVSISIAGNPFIDYTIPTFADALFTPTVTADPNQLYTMASDIRVMVETIQGSAKPMPAQQIITSPYGF